jgi:hemerythrin-like metal-binding protein
MRDALSLQQDEHAVLSWQCRMLQEAVNDGQPAPLLRRYVQGLIDTARNHFASEDRTMEAASYPASDGHKREHARLLREAGGLLRQVDALSEPCDWPRVAGELRSWLFQHMADYDHLLEEYLDRRDR